MTVNFPCIDTARQFYEKRDEAYWIGVEELIRKSGIRLSEVLINYPAFIRRRELPRLLADYEIFKLIVDLPGSIAELGVYLGAGLFTWSKLLETFVPGDRSRRVYGFDNCAGYSPYATEDGDADPWVKTVIGPKVVQKDFLVQMVKLTNDDNLVPGLERCRVILGDISETVPEFANNNQGTRLSLIYFDANLYEPTMTGLRNLYPLLMPGGVIAFNGYGAPPWQGEALAFERYFQEIGEKQPVLRKFPFSVHPSGYFVKG